MLTFERDTEPYALLRDSKVCISFVFFDLFELGLADPSGFSLPPASSLQICNLAGSLGVQVRSFASHTLYDPDDIIAVQLKSRKHPTPSGGGRRSGDAACGASAAAPLVAGEYRFSRGQPVTVYNSFRALLAKLGPPQSPVAAPAIGDIPRLSRFPPPLRLGTVGAPAPGPASSRAPCTAAAAAAVSGAAIAPAFSDASAAAVTDSAECGAGDDEGLSGAAFRVPALSSLPAYRERYTMLRPRRAG